MDVEEKLSLKPYNTFGVNVKAVQIITVTKSEELIQNWQNACLSGLPVLVLGEGSNILFLDNFNGTVILNRIMGVKVEDQGEAWLLHVGAGENWHNLVKYTLDHNMPGLENLALIPGCAGSAPIQNIGAYGVEFKEVCQYVDCVELTSSRFHRLVNRECEFGYRDSIFKNKYQYYAITAVGILLPKKWKPVLTYGDLKHLSESVTPHEVFDAVCQIRRTKLLDPEVVGNAGSFFKNPTISTEEASKFLIKYPNAPYYAQVDGRVKLAAAWLIDQCGLKGYKVGGAKVHSGQPLVLINENNATSQDIVSLARFVRQSVAKKFEILLEPEVRFIGPNGEVDAVKTISQ